MIFVCDFFVISREVYEKKISDSPLGANGPKRRRFVSLILCHVTILFGNFSVILFAFMVQVFMAFERNQ